MAKKKNQNISISFVDSQSSEDVTGSCVYIKTPNHNILLDCGLHQTNDKYEDFLVNNRKTKEFKPKDIDLVFIMHIHGDHCLLLPKLFKYGCEAGVVIPELSKNVYEKMLVDCAGINERDILVINNQHNKNYEPLYDLSHVQKTLEHTMEFPVNEKIYIDDEISFKFVPSGHLLGGCQIVLYVTINNVTKTIGYTSDIGSNKIDNYFVGKFEEITDFCNVFITETTYGDKPELKIGQKERNNDLDKIKSIIDTQVKDLHGRVVIPSFAQSRIQQLALMIYELYKDLEWQPKVYIDSPLAISIFKEYKDLLSGEESDIYNKMLEWDNLVFVKESEDSKMLVESKEPCVILSTSGMCNIGRIRHHLKSAVSNPNATLLFVGFSTEGTLASILKDKNTKSITIDTKEYPCRCSVYNLKSMSGHAMFDQLLSYSSSVRAEKIILHHGSKKAKETFAKELKKELEKKCSTARVIVSNSSLKFTL